MLEQERVQMTI